MKSRWLLLALTCLLLFVSPVFAVPEGDEVNLLNLPHQLGTALGVGDTAGGYFASMILLCLFLFPSIMLSGYFGGQQSVMYTTLIVGLSITSLCVHLGWLPYWLLILVVIVVGLMFSGNVRGWITGKGE